MNRTSFARWVMTGLWLAGPTLVHAAAITDPAGDFLPTFGGTTAETDLDVQSASVFYDASTDLFKLTTTVSGPVGKTPTGFYVWGVNTGSGTAAFAANGIDGVRFNAVVILRPDGSGAIGGTALPAGSVSILGNTITGIFKGALLPSTGFTNRLDYTWNIWPRDGAYTGFAAIADFAPDNANFSTTPGAVVAAVPEASTPALLAAGLIALAFGAHRRRQGASGRD